MIVSPLDQFLASRGTLWQHRAAAGACVEWLRPRGTLLLEF